MIDDFAFGFHQHKSPQAMAVARELFLWVECCHNYLPITYAGATNTPGKRELSRAIIVINSVKDE